MSSSLVSTDGNHELIDIFIQDKLLGRRIGVIGAGSCDNSILKIAYRVGELIAKSGAILYCGGLGGVMKAASKGAFENGGITVGILPGNSAKEANPYIKIPIVTSLSHMRNFVIVKSSEILIAISGGYGTLSEIAFALKLGVPIIGIETFENFSEITYVSSPEEAIKKAIELLGNLFLGKSEY